MTSAKSAWAASSSTALTATTTTLGVDSSEGDDVYSTSETTTNKVWLGKTVYRKVISLGALPNTTSKSVAHGISDATQFIQCRGFFYNGLILGELPYSDPTDANCISMSVNSTNVTVGTGSDRSARNGYAILEYVKD